MDYETCDQFVFVADMRGVDFMKVPTQSTKALSTIQYMNTPLYPDFKVRFPLRE